MTLQLFYSPGACSLSPHIALREAGLPFELVRVNLKTKTTEGDADFLAIHAKGYVPALLTEDGELISEGAIIVQYIADRVPDARLAPSHGTKERRRLQEWLHFIATELHKGFGPLNHPSAGEPLKAALREKLDKRFAILARGVTDRPYLLGEDFSVADGYAYYVLRSLRKLDTAALEGNETLRSYFERIGQRPSVRAALAAEGVV